MAEFPQVPEHGAPPEIATLYADIRAVSGLPVVNLIWRHFAALPGVLPWVWSATRPLIGSAELDGARERLASGVSLPSIPPPSIMAWRSAGIGNRDLQRIAAMNDAYIRGNLTNVLALTALRLRLERPDHPAARLHPGQPLHQQPSPIDRLPRIDDLPPDLAARIRSLARRHDGEGDGVIPSLYLALAPWPGVIEELPNWLAPLYAPSTLRSVRASTCRLVEAEAEQLLPAPGPAPAAAAAMQPGLQLFTRVVIPDLIAVCFALHGLLPAASPPAQY